MSFRTISLFALLSFLASFSFAQVTIIDSLEIELQNKILNDTSKVNLLLNIAKLICETDNDRTLLYCEEARKISESLSYKEGVARSYKISSIYYISNNMFPNSIDDARKSLEIFNELVAISEIAVCNGIIASSYYYQGELDTALVYFSEALIYLYKENNKSLIARTLTNIGNIYSYRGNYPKALDYYQKALAIQEDLNNDYSIAINTFNIGDIYRAQKKLDEAQENYLFAYESFKNLGLKFQSATALTHISGIMDLRLRYDTAQMYQLEAMQIMKEIGNIRGYTTSLHNYCVTLTNLGEYLRSNDSLTIVISNFKELEYIIGLSRAYEGIGRNFYYLKNYNNALKYTLLAFDIAVKHNLLEHEKYASLLLSEIYQKKNKYELALKNYINYKEISDSLFNETDIEKLADLKNQYEFDKEKNELELEQQKRDAITSEKRKQETLLRNSLIVGLFLVVIIAIFIFKNFIQKRRANRILAENIQEIRMLNESKDKIFSIIAHDLRGPMGNMKAFLEFIISEHSHYNQQEIINFIESIGQQSAAAFNILDNLLAWANSQRNVII